MSTALEIRDERVNLRLSSHIKQKLESAARFEGKTVSKFILGCAVAQAEQTIQKYSTMQLAEQDAQRLFDALAKPIQFNDALTAALADHERTVESK